MDCKKIKNKLFFLADGTLDKDERIQILKHLDQCTSCMRQYELFSGFENILQEEKKSSPDDYFYTRLISRMEQLNSVPAGAKVQPVWIRLANVFIITIIIGIALFSGITIAERNYQYMGESQNNLQVSDQQNDVALGQDQFTSNFSEY
jgi:hypothetical protein